MKRAEKSRSEAVLSESQDNLEESPVTSVGVYRPGSCRDSTETAEPRESRLDICGELDRMTAWLADLERSAGRLDPQERELLAHVSRAAERLTSRLAALREAEDE